MVGPGLDAHDLLGREYIDCLGGYGIFSAGVNHPKIVRAVTDQMERMALNSQELLEPWRGALARLLAEVTPGDLQNSFFINNGTDAIEGAIKLARLYTGRNTVHLDPRRVPRQVDGLALADGQGLVPRAVRGRAAGRALRARTATPTPWRRSSPRRRRWARGSPASWSEPVQGEAGGVVPPDDYFPRVRELCTRYGALLIADEVQTGMGRTGKLWGVDHWDVVPDIMCLGKSLGGGVMPLSAFISTPEIWEVMIPNPIIHSTTFGGNPLACAAGIAAIQVTLEEDLPGQAAAKGEFLLRELGALQEQVSPGARPDVHGKGC